MYSRTSSDVKTYNILKQTATYPYPDEIPDGQVDQSIAMTPIVSGAPSLEFVSIIAELRIGYEATQS